MTTDTSHEGAFPSTGASAPPDRRDPLPSSFGPVGGNASGKTPGDPTGLGDDLLEGADEIAAFLFGDATKSRKIYHLKKKRLPVFRFGSQLCARRSTLLKWIADQEARGY